MTTATLAAPAPRAAWRQTLAFRVFLSVLLALVVTGVLVLLAGKNPLLVYPPA